MQKDNSTFLHKREIRRAALKLLSDVPVIMETHGGFGKLYRACYESVERGVVFEKDAVKAEALALQRPTWAVYQADCVKAIADGAGAHLTVNVLDCDPYGEAWPVIDAFFESKRPRAATLLVLVNDGLRQGLKMGTAAHVGSMAGMVARYGNNLHKRYLEICEMLLEEKAAKAGYRLDRFYGYYCGYMKQMTHYMGLLTFADRPGSAS